LRTSLLDRVQRECGLAANDLLELTITNDGWQPVTSYTAKGKRRFTLVLPATAALPATAKLAAADSNIAQACWTQLPVVWDSVAPANRLILARALATTMSDSEREDARVHIDAALQQCNAWAEEVGLPTLSHPWASRRSGP
jgi:hypothetical protein